MVHGDPCAKEQEEHSEDREDSEPPQKRLRAAKGKGKGRKGRGRGKQTLQTAPGDAGGEKNINQVAELAAESAETSCQLADVLRKEGLMLQSWDKPEGGAVLHHDKVYICLVPKNKGKAPVKKLPSRLVIHQFLHTGRVRFEEFATMSAAVPYDLQDNSLVLFEGSMKMLKDVVSDTHPHVWGKEKNGHGTWECVGAADNEPEKMQLWTPSSKDDIKTLSVLLKYAPTLKPIFILAAKEDEEADTLVPAGVAFILPKAFSVPNADSDEPFELESLAGAADAATA